jgi:hypothetical protein
VLLDTGVDEHHVQDDRFDQRDADDRRSRELQAGHDARQVHSEGDEEDRHQDRHEAIAILFTQRVDDDALAREVEQEFGDDLAAAGNELQAPSADQQENDEQDQYKQSNELEAVQRKRRTREEDRRREKVID